MSLAANVRVRRVGFRGGTDEELTALHAVEVPVAAECGSNRMPTPLESYKAFARNLPSQFDDHAWLVEMSDKFPVAAGFCWSNAAGDARVMECEVFVLPESRRQGIASRLLAAICDDTASEGRSLLMWSTYDAVPAGEVFSNWIGARVARVNRTSELVLSGVDWAMVERWALAERARELGYRLEMIDGAFPEHLRDDAATFHHIMQTAPRDDLDAGRGQDRRRVRGRARSGADRVRHVVPIRDRDDFRRQVPGATVVEIDANHLSVNTHPDTVSAMQRFLTNPRAR